MHFFGLLVCLMLMACILTLGTLAETQGPQSTIVLAVGFVLLTAYLAGRVSHRVRLPRITGYLLLGILIGPRLLNLINEEMSQGLLFVNGLTVSLIALSAGGEIKLEWLRKHFRQIAAIGILGAGVVFLIVAGAVLLLQSWFPMPAQSSFALKFTIATIFGIFAVANSPMVVIALITESGSRGALSQIVLGVTVLRDVMVIVLFSVVLAVADVLIGGESVSIREFGLLVGREIGGSIVLGILLGAGLALCTKHFWREMPLVVIVTCASMAHLGTTFHTDPLLMGLVAGFFVENIARKGGDELVAGIERCSLPLYCLFFGIAGIMLDIRALADLWPAALAFASVRAAGLWAGTQLGARISACEPKIASYGWMGFVANAGVLLAMASIVARTFPDWGPPIQTLVVAVIAINLLAGPIGFRYALIASGEAQKT